MCWKCGKAILFEAPIGRTMTCASCGSDIRVCRNCRFYSPGAWHDCAERVVDGVQDKERANFCDSFQLKPAFKKDHPAVSSGADEGKKQAARSAFDGLFGS